MIFSSHWGRMLWLFLCGFNGAVGTNLEVRWFYLVVGFSWVDLMIAYEALRLSLRDSPRRGLFTGRLQGTHALAVSGLVTWLIFSIAVNAFRFDAQIVDVLPCLKLLYLVLLTTVIARYASKYGVKVLVLGFVCGVLVVTIQDLIMSPRSVGLVPLLQNPNVTGALIGLGVWFSAFGLVLGWPLLTNLLAALTLTGLSITTFSKGTWLMCALGLAMGILTVLTRRQSPASVLARFLTGALALAMLVGASVIAYENRDALEYSFSHKYATSVEEGGGIDARADFVRASIRAGLDYPVFGLGFRNFYKTQILYPDLDLPQLERLDNAHNLFAQILVAGGIPGLVLFVILFWIPFFVLWHKLEWWLPSRSNRVIVWTLSLGVWFIYGAVQLQLMAQPPFWLFCGIVFGLQRNQISAASSR